MPPDADPVPTPAAARPPAPAAAWYRFLVAGGCGDGFDRHLFASVLALAATEAERRLTDATGLSTAALKALFAAYFPHASGWLDDHLARPAAADPRLADALEEADLERLLLDHRSDRTAAAGGWLATILARRSLGDNHLWQDLGLGNRGELGLLMRRHFRPLADANDGDMKWKKFFYRMLCGRDGVLVCKAPHCGACDDRGHCFGAEAGEPLIRFGGGG